MIHTMRGAGDGLKPAQEAGRAAKRADGAPRTLTDRLAATADLLLAVVSCADRHLTAVAAADQQMQQLDPQGAGLPPPRLRRRRDGDKGAGRRDAAAGVNQAPARRSPSAALRQRGAVRGASC